VPWPRPGDARVCQGRQHHHPAARQNLFLPQSRTLARKLEETVLAWRLQTKLPRKRMLELYLNVIELGPHIRGVKQAARAYFGKELGDLRPSSRLICRATPNPQGLARRFRDGGSTTAGCNACTTCWE